MAATEMGTKGFARRGERVCTARATSSLPVPLSPSMRMLASLGAALRRTSNTAAMAPEEPTIPSIATGSPAAGRRARSSSIRWRSFTMSSL